MEPNLYEFFRFLEREEKREIPLPIKILNQETSLTAEDLHVKGDIEIPKSVANRLPDNLIIDGSMSFSYDCIDLPLITLPRNLYVRDTLNITNLNVYELPPDIWAYELVCPGTPIAERHSKDLHRYPGFQRVRDYFIFRRSTWRL